MRAHHKLRRRSRSSAFSLESLEPRKLLSGGNSFDGGTMNAMAIASDGTLYLAYFKPTDATHGDLHYAVRNADGTWRANGADGGIIDNSSIQVGMYVSMALDSTGKPGIAYNDAYNADLKYAHFNGTGWDTGLVYSATGKRGNYPSLAYLNDKPTISHFVKTSTGTNSAGFLAVDQTTSLTPPAASAWTTTALNNTGDAGRYSSLVYNPNTSKWGVSYDDNGASRGGRYMETSGTSVTSGWGSVETIPAAAGKAASNALWTSLAYDTNNKPAFAWYDNADFNANFSHRNGTTPNFWNTGVVDGHNTTGKYPVLNYESGKFRMAYFDQSNNWAEVQSGGDTGGGWLAEPVLTASGGSELKLVRKAGVTTFAWSDGLTLFVNDDSTGEKWTKQSGSTAFGGRQLHSSVAFDPGFSGDAGAKMWVIGGRVGLQRNDRVDYSNDGLVWHKARDNGAAGGFGGRDSHASAVFDAKMWVVGGQSGGLSATANTDVWASADGTTWTQATSGGSPVNLGPRRGTAAVAFNSNLFVIGGASNDLITQYPTYPVQYSSDGSTWSGLTTAAFQRSGHTALVYHGSIYVIGGSGNDTRTYKSDSTGTSWSLAGADGVSNQPFNGVPGVVYDDKMWMITGGGAYWSTNGVDWTAALPDPDGVTPFDGRAGASAVVLPLNGSDKMWVLGGQVLLGQSLKDEAWFAD